MDSMSYRLIRRGEEEEAFSMIERGFNAFVRDDFSQEGVDEFHRAIRNMVFNHTLLDHAIALCRERKPGLNEIEVHSSPWAVSVYGKLGFEATGPEQEKCGIRYTRMVKKLEPQSG